MELLRSAAGEARSMYQTVVNSNIPVTENIATITKRVADTKDLEMFLCMGPHIKSILNYTEVVTGFEFLRNFRLCVQKLEDRLGDEEWYANVFFVCPYVGTAATLSLNVSYFK